jgi:hypothetical protein
LIALNFIEHFKKEELILLFKGIFIVLHEGGVLILHTSNGQAILSPHLAYDDLIHLTIFTPNSVQQLLRIVGFKKDYLFMKPDPFRKILKGLFVCYCGK